jgi:hypothetical protein
MLPPQKAAATRKSARPPNREHDVVWQEILARRRIEQHAYIPYTHGSRRAGDDLTTKRVAARRIFCTTGAKYSNVSASIVSPLLIASNFSK